MLSNIHAGIYQLRENLLNMEKRLQTCFPKTPAKPASNVSSTLDNRPPWNHGGRYTRSNSTIPYEVPQQRSPVRTRSRTPNPSAGHAVSSVLQASHHKTRTVSKQIVHKQTIKPSDKTILEVSVKTKQQGKRTRNTTNPSLTGSEDQLVHQFANVVISPEAKKYDPPCVKRGVVPANCKASWSNILERNPHSVMPDGISNKRSCEVSPNVPKRGPAAFAEPEIPAGEFPKSSEGRIPSTNHHHDSGDCTISKNMNAYRKLRLLIQELRRNAGDPNTQRIVADLEDILANLYSKENVEPPAASLRPSSHGPTLQKQNHQSPSTSPKRVTPHEWGFEEFHHLTAPNLLRLSPTPGSAERHFPESGTNGYKSEISHLLDEFRQALSAAARPSQPAEEKPHSKKSRRKDIIALQEQVEKACRALEVTCAQIEADGEKSKQEKIELERILEDRTEELLSARKCLQEKMEELVKLRADMQQANQEIQNLRAEEAKKGFSDDRQEDLQSMEKRIDKLTEDNRKMGIQLNIVKLEKESLSVILTNKDKELDKFKQEIATRKPRKVITEVVELRDSDIGAVNVGESKEKNRVKKVVKSEEAKNINSVAKLEEEENLMVTTRSKKEDSEVDVESVAKTKEEEHMECKPGEKDYVELEASKPKGEESVIVEGTGTPRRYVFLPVNREWQKKVSKRFGFEIVKLLKESRRRKPLNPPNICQSTGMDGNCFFRCISLYIVGDEKEHKKIRAEVIRYMTRHTSEFEEGNDENYLKAMAKDGTWATEVEIRATARLLQTPIFTWAKYNEQNWKWLRFGSGSDFNDDNVSDRAPSLYIKNTFSCHYDVVTSICSDTEDSTDFFK